MHDRLKTNILNEYLNVWKAVLFLQVVFLCLFLLMHYWLAENVYHITLMHTYCTHQWWSKPRPWFSTFWKCGFPHKILFVKKHLRNQYNDVIDFDAHCVCAIFVAHMFPFFFSLCQQHYEAILRKGTGHRDRNAKYILQIKLPESFA